MKRHYAAFIFFCGLGIGVSGPVSAQSESAPQVVEHFLASVKSPDQTAQANGYLALEAMGQKALGGHWTEATPAQQQAFMDLLWKLIENVAYPRSRKFLGSQAIEYGVPKPLAGGAGVEVATIVKNQEPGLDVPIIYHLEEAAGNWKIHDILLDGVPLTEDLKYQFDTVIQESSFDGLLDKMRERLEKAKAEPAPQSAAAPAK